MEDDNLFLENLASAVDTDPLYLEVLIPYLKPLCEVGINFNDYSLQDAISGNIHHLETACQAVIGYAGYLAMAGKTFGSLHHATDCFRKALMEHWRPHDRWQTMLSKAIEARYNPPFTRALMLIHRLKEIDSNYLFTYDLDNLSPIQLEDLIPQLQQTLQQYEQRIS
jgi:hypothetical protein